jgi:hypothetical protein
MSSSNLPEDRQRLTGGSRRHQPPPQQPRPGDVSFGQTASDSQLLRQFARAYDEQVRRDTSPTLNETLDVADMTPDPAGGESSLLVMGARGVRAAAGGGDRDGPDADPPLAARCRAEQSRAALTRGVRLPGGDQARGASPSQGRRGQKDARGWGYGCNLRSPAEGRASGPGLHHAVYAAGETRSDASLRCRHSQGPIGRKGSGGRRLVRSGIGWRRAAARLAAADVSVSSARGEVRQTAQEMQCSARGWACGW